MISASLRLAGLCKAAQAALPLNLKEAKKAQVEAAVLEHTLINTSLSMRRTWRAHSKMLQELKAEPASV